MLTNIILTCLVVHEIEVTRMIQVANAKKNDPVVAQVVNVVDPNRNQVKKSPAVLNAVHHVLNQRITKMGTIEYQIIQKKVHHRQQDVNVTIVAVEKMMLKTKTRVVMKVTDE